MALIYEIHLFTEGEPKKEREQELKMMMKRLEAKYAALQIVPVISKLGTNKVRRKKRELIELSLKL